MIGCVSPIFEPVFDEASFGYRRGRSAKDALRKIWCEVEQGYEWVVDADLKDFFGSAVHEKLMVLLNQRVADGRVLALLESIMKVGYLEDGKVHQTQRGVPQGGVISPLISNVLLTPFDREMRRKGYRLTRFADDWVVTCRTRAEAQSALTFATKVLEKLGVVLNEDKTRIVHVRHGFEFLGYKIKRGSRPLRLPAHKIKSRTRQGALYAYPRQKSIDHFKEKIRKRTRRKAPVTTGQLIDEINPVIRGWGNYYKKAHVRKLFNRLDRWIRRRIWSHRYKRWRNAGWEALSESKLHGELGLVSLIKLIPSLNRRNSATL
jgi:group II intron reverse transcriptase/maturase